MNKIKGLVIFIISLSLVWLSACSQNTAQSDNDNNETNNSDYPNKPIEIVVPFSAGGSTDTVARLLAENVSKYLPNNQPVAVINIPGGGGAVGMTEVANAKPDGYKIGYTTLTSVSTQPLYGQTSYNYDSFQPIMNVTFVPMMLLVQADSPWKTFEEWLDYVKKNPGEFNYTTSTGPEGVEHVGMEKLMMEENLNLKYVPYQSRSEAVAALLGGHVDGAIAMPREGEQDQLRPLINFSGDKTGEFKDTPLLKEKGFDIEASVNTGLFAPKELPDDILKILDSAFKKTLEDPEFIAGMKNLQLEPNYKGPGDFAKIIKTKHDNDEIMLKNLNLIDE
ncbi:hypothetical protein F3157_17540 [Virgibacillus dakarensis]|nr:hypothetical protein [Virgibacillus dakarensis]